MYNAVIISVFNSFEVGYVECKNLVAIPLALRCRSEQDIFKKLRIQSGPGFERLLAVKFVRIQANFIAPLNKFKILRVKHKVIEETSWYINSTYDALSLKQIHKLADPVILLQNDKRRIKYWIDYYVDLRRRGYSEEEAINTIYG